jgi:tRNA pseudouridine65 synthase
MLEILYQDEYIVAINKPSGLLVLQIILCAWCKVYAIQELRNQIGGQHVYPVHRLDRKTSGVLLFALNKDVLKIMNRFAREVEKKYCNFTWLVTRRTNDWLWFNQWWWHIQNAITYFHRLQTTEIELEFNNKPTSRYCLVEAIPETGMHQWKHFKHIFHPILGSRTWFVINKINYGWSILNWKEWCFMHIS